MCSKRTFFVKSAVSQLNCYSRVVPEHDIIFPGCCDICHNWIVSPGMMPYDTIELLVPGCCHMCHNWLFVPDRCHTDHNWIVSPGMLPCDTIELLVPGCCDICHNWIVSPGMLPCDTIELLVPVCCDRWHNWIVSPGTLPGLSTPADILLWSSLVNVKLPTRYIFLRNSQTQNTTEYLRNIHYATVN